MFFTDLNIENRGLLFGASNFVDDSFIDKVNNYIKMQSLVKGTFKHSLENPDGPKNLDDIRNSEIHWMAEERYKDTLMPLYNELTSKIREVNNRQWRWIIDGWEAFQYSEYDESYKGHYDWHIDYGLRPPDEPFSRKLSFSLGISEKDDYEGGELLVKMSVDTQSIKLDKGEIFIFPSWMIHKVTPVTKGKRKVIVGWGLGPVV